MLHLGESGKCYTWVGGGKCYIWVRVPGIRSKQQVNICHKEQYLQSDNSFTTRIERQVDRDAWSMDKLGSDKELEDWY